MSIDDARAMASQWSETLSAASRNLVDFSASELCLLTKARLRPDHPSPYKGTTLSKGLAARIELDALLQDYLPLARVVEEAQSFANRSGMLFNYEKQVTELLCGRSVKLAVPVQAAQGSRDLLQGARPDDYATPAQALESMQRRFAAAHDDFVAIHEAQKSFSDQAAAFETRRQTIEAKARSMGIDDASLAGIRQNAFELDSQDPLGSSQSIAKAFKALESAESSLNSKAAEADQSRHAIEQASLALMALRSSCARASIARDEAAERIALTSALPEAATHDALAFLEQWKAKLCSTRDAGRHAACLIGSAKLSAAIADQTQLTELALAACRAPLDELDDLRGRLDAFAAKANAMQAKGAQISPSIWQLHSACAQELSRHPANLMALAKLIGSFESCVSALGS